MEYNQEKLPKINILIIDSSNVEEANNIFNGKFIENYTLKFSKDIDYSDFTDKLINISEQLNCDVSVYFFDKNYSIEYFYTEEGKEEYELIKELKSEYEFFNCTFYEYIRSKSFIFNENEAYYFVTKKHYSDCYEFADYLDIKLSNNFFFKWDLKKIEDIINAKAYYNLFSNIPRASQVDFFGNNLGENVNIEDIVKIVKIGVEQCNELKEAGCLRNERFLQKNVKNWVTNVYTKFSIGVIREFEFYDKKYETSNDLVIVQQEPQKLFNENSKYRMILLKTMINVLVKYGIEFGKIQTFNNSPETVNLNLL
jgi:hypothetical protein